MVGIGLMIPANNGIDMGELRLDEHLGMEDDDDGDDDDFDDDDFDDNDVKDDENGVKDTGLKRAISAGLPSTKIMFTMSFPMCRFLST